jgi:hypothetical protein
MLGVARRGSFFLSFSFHYLFFLKKKKKKKRLIGSDRREEEEEEEEKKVSEAGRSVVELEAKYYSH